MNFNSKLDMCLDLGHTVVVLSNYDAPAAEAVASYLWDMITR